MKRTLGFKRYGAILLCLILMLAFVPNLLSLRPAFAEEPTQKVSDAVISHTGGVAAADVFTFENEVIKMTLKADATDGVRLTSVINKEAGNREMLSSDKDDTSLFNYVYARYKTAGYRYFNASEAKIITGKANGGFDGGYEITDIVMRHTDGATTSVLGKRLQFWVTEEDCPINVLVEMELYNGRSGVKYCNYLKNTSEDTEYTILKSDVLTLGFNRPGEDYALLYPGNESWKYVENGVIAPHNGGVNTSTTFKQFTTARNVIALIDTANPAGGYGWYVAPEVNWQTQLGPDVPGEQGNTRYTYPFASINAYDGRKNVNIFTNPEAVQLTLFPGEKFEYIAVDFTVFKAKDQIDGKMAVEEHLRKRFKFNDTNLIINTNDWDWLGNANKEGYYEEVVVPMAKLGGLEMVMMDDLWNTTRDSVVLKEERMGGDMQKWADYVKSEGFIVGLWYSLIGDDHNNGRDLADPDMLAEKKEQIMFLIDNYYMNHQMIDLTEFWQTTFDTSYSHAGDSVFRKNILTNAMLNSIVEERPWYRAKLTNEMDVYPTQGDRNTELGHLVDNGWLVIAGDLSGFSTYTSMLGHQPMNAVYTGGSPDGNMERYYGLMIGRNAKFNTDPGTWSQEGTALLGKFNAWRRTDKINDIVNNTLHPVYFGQNFTDYKTWNPGKGPYAWGWTDEAREEALVIATSNMQTDGRQKITGDFRFMDKNKTYVITDITMDENGVQNHKYVATVSGAELLEKGFEIDLTQGKFGTKALWLEAVDASADAAVGYSDGAESVTAAVAGSSVNVTVTGQPLASANITIVTPANAKGKTLTVKIGSSGTETLSVPVSELSEGFTGYARPQSVTATALDAHNGAPGAIGYTLGAGVSESWFTSTANTYMIDFKMVTVGNYVDFELSAAQLEGLIPAGSYKLHMGVQTHVENRGVARLKVYYNDDADPSETSRDQTLIGSGNNVNTSFEMLSLTLPNNLKKVRIRMELAALGSKGNSEESKSRILFDYFRFEPVTKSGALTVSGLPTGYVGIGYEAVLDFTCTEASLGDFRYEDYAFEISETDYGVIQISADMNNKVTLTAGNQGSATVTVINKRNSLVKTVFTINVSAVSAVKIGAVKDNTVQAPSKLDKENPYKFALSAEVSAPAGAKELGVEWAVVSVDGKPSSIASIDSATGELTVTGIGQIKVMVVAKDGSGKTDTVILSITEKSSSDAKKDGGCGGADAAAGLALVGGLIAAVAVVKRR